MRRALILLAAFATAPPALAAVPTFEAALQAPAQGRIVTRGGAWNCGAAGCTAQSDASRPMIQCQLLAKEVGALSRFAVDGVAFDADTLAKCNKKAK